MVFKSQTVSFTLQNTVLVYWPTESTIKSKCNSAACLRLDFSFPFMLTTLTRSREQHNITSLNDYYSYLLYTRGYLNVYFLKVPNTHLYTIYYFCLVWISKKHIIMFSVRIHTIKNGSCMISYNTHKICLAHDSKWVNEKRSERTQHIYTILYS